MKPLPLRLTGAGAADTSLTNRLVEQLGQSQQTVAETPAPPRRRQRHTRLRQSALLAACTWRKFPSLPLIRSYRLNAEPSIRLAQEAVFAKFDRCAKAVIGRQCSESRQWAQCAWCCVFHQWLPLRLIRKKCLHLAGVQSGFRCH